MRKLRFIALVAPVVGLSFAAEAGLAVSTWPEPAQLASFRTRSAPTDGTLAVSLAEGITLPADVGGTLADPGLPAWAGEVPEETLVKELPPAPDSLTLFLTAFGTLGAWRLTRLARRMPFGQLPAWYHEGAPARIGHSFASDLQFDSLAPCCVEQAAVEHSVCRFWQHEFDPRCVPQWSPLTSAPRGPPALPF